MARQKGAFLGPNSAKLDRDPSHHGGSHAKRGGNEKKTPAWAVGGTLVSGDASTNVSLQFTFAEPGAHTVQFSIALPDLTGIAGATGIKCEALITWETNGNTTTRRITVAEGMTIQGQGETCKVVFSDTTLLGDAIVPDGQLGLEYGVSAAVAPGTRGSFTNPPVLWENNVATVVTAGNTHYVPVPADAGATSVCVFVGSPDGTALAEQTPQVQQVAPDASGGAQAWYDPRAFAFAPLIPGVSGVVLQNRSLTGQAIYFSVLWGVDG